MPYEIGQVLRLPAAIRKDVPPGIYIMLSPSGGSLVYLCRAEEDKSGRFRRTDRTVEISGQELWAFEPVPQAPLIFE